MSIVNNKPLVKTVLDTFPVTVPFVLPKSIYAAVSNDESSPNSVDFLLVDSGEVLRVAPGETKQFNATTNALEGTIEATFYGAAKTNINYTEGDSGGSADIVNRLDAKQGPGYLLDLSNSDGDPFPAYPFTFLEGAFMFNTTGLDFNYEILKNSPPINSLTDFVASLNLTQQWVNFSIIDSTTLLVQSSVVDASSLTNLELELGGVTVEFVQSGTQLIYAAGDTLTSNLDFLREDVKVIKQAVMSQTSFNITQLESLGPGVFGATPIKNFKTLTFTVPDAASTVLVEITDQANSNIGSQTFPIVGTDLTIYGDTIRADYTSQMVVTFSGTGLVYINRHGQRGD